MKKSTLLPISIIVFVAIVTITLVYNYCFISPSHHLITSTCYVGVNKFGIKEIYLSKTGGEEWFINMDDPGNDPRIGGERPPTTFL
ncbi:MAG: hypothetical protein WAM14_27065 [Candidatus Nitrosopolaris sp.]